MDFLRESIGTFYLIDDYDDCPSATIGIRTYLLTDGHISPHDVASRMSFIGKLGKLFRLAGWQMTVLSWPDAEARGNADPLSRVSGEREPSKLEP